MNNKGFNSKLALTFALIALPFCQASANEIPCEFDDNSEWPWAYDRVCQSDSSPLTEPSALMANDGWGVPLCSSASADPDGDGWGWENYRSCRVSETQAAVKQVTMVDGFPVCTKPGSDPDNDGWGWENHRSCKTTSSSNSMSHLANGQKTNTQKPVTKYTPTFPSCSNNSSDSDGDGWGWEYGRSCLVSSESKSAVDNTPAASNGSTKNGSTTVVFQQDFNSSNPGTYNGNDLNDEWDTPFWHLGFNQGRVHITSEPGRGNAMRVTYPAHKYGAAGASAFLTDVQFGVDLPKSYDELYVSYDVKFAKGFDFVKGGKLPGLCGYDNTQSPVNGCNTGGGFPHGYDGWSARGMWREGGKLENYVYHSSQESYYGDDEYWGAAAVPGKWHTIEHRVVLNTVGRANGILEAWLDGRKVLSENDFVYRKTGQIGINLFYFSTFYGGNDPSWAPSQDQYVYFDNIRITTRPKSEALAMAYASNDETTQAFSIGETTGETSGKSSGGSGGGGFGAFGLVLLIGLRKLRRQ